MLESSDIIGRHDTGNPFHLNKFLKNGYDVSIFFTFVDNNGSIYIKIVHYISDIYVQHALGFCLCNN
jgi:hypothetical protein